MPELPEVETVVRNLREPLIGHIIEDMWFDWHNTLHSPTPEIFKAQITGQTFLEINRRAKYIICKLTHDFLVVHLKMTGRLYVADKNTKHDADRWVHFRLDLDDNKELRFSDSRKFGRVYLTNDINTITHKLGPEPLEDTFTTDVFKKQLCGRKKNIKALLLDQSFIAGVGNIYADEALYRAKIHPLRSADNLNADEIARLYQSVRDALNAGITHEGASISWYRKPDGSKGSSQNYFYVYGRDNKPCQTCGYTIQKVRVAQRGTHFCPVCQPEK